MNREEETISQLMGQLAEAGHRIAELEQALKKQKEIEEGLRRGEERFREFMENISDECYETDLDGNITYINEIASLHSGYSRDEMIGMSHRQYSPPEEAKRIFKFFNEIYRSGKPAIVHNYEQFTRAGQSRYVDMSVSLIRDGRGEPIGFRGISRDVTERKKYLDELERYRDFMENIADGCFENDLDGTITYANEVGSRRLGYTREEFIGMNNTQYSSPEEVARVNEVFRRIYRTGKPAIIDEYEIIRKDGSRFFIEMSAALIRDAAGKPIGYRGTTRDITEKKKAQEALRKSESQYRFLTEQMSDIVWTLDENMLVTYISPSIESVLGYPREAVLGHDPGKLFMTEESYAHTLDVINGEAMRREQDPHRIGISVSLEVACRHCNGSIVWLNVVVSCIRDDAGKVVGFHSVARNVTQQKQAEEEKEKLICELQAALSEVKKLSGMLPICAHCKKIRDDQGYWNQMESYITQHSEALFSHCICPECASKVYGEYFPKKNK